MIRSPRNWQRAARLLSSLACACSLAAGALGAPAAVSITIDPASQGPEIPADFVGLSFGMKTLLPKKDGSRFFSPTNQPLVTLLQNVGVVHLRLGGTTVESPPTTPVPDQADIDSVFALARAARVRKIIYSFPLLETNAALHYDTRNAALAKYIWDHHRDLLDAFSLGNEPDLHRVFYQDVSITNFATYIEKWDRFARAIKQAVPEARFAGPDGGSGNISWTLQFSRSGKTSGLVSTVTEHFYVGGAGRGVAPADGIRDMLSRDWVAANQTIYDKVAVPVAADGFPFRFTEANDHYSGGAIDSSDTFAGALWALDFLHWWAVHNAVGVNFHNTQWVVNDVITLDLEDRLEPTPKGYGLKAFSLASHGSVEKVAIANPEGINLTAYAVSGAKEHFVTLINKEYGPGSHEAAIRINGIKAIGAPSMMWLQVKNADVSEKSGVTLGSAPITSDKPWEGKWNTMPSFKGGDIEFKLPAASAVIVRIPAR